MCEEGLGCSGVNDWWDPQMQMQYEVWETKWLGDSHSEGIPTFVLFPTPHLETWDTAQSCTRLRNVLSSHPVLRVAQEGSGLKQHRVGSDFCESLPEFSEVRWMMGESGVPYFEFPFKSPGPGPG